MDDADLMRVAHVLAALVALFVAYHALFAPSPSRPLTKKWSKFKIMGKKTVSRSQTRPVVFFTIGAGVSGLPTGSHVRVRAEDPETGKMVERKYTPTRFDGKCCELMLRIYPYGKLTQLLYKLNVGDDIEMCGPVGLHRYALKGPGTFSHGKKSFGPVKRIGMIAGGTGITPMLQIINHVLQDPDDNTQLHLLECNSTSKDIMMEARLRDLASSSGGQLTVTFAISNAEEGQTAESDRYTFASLSKDTLDASAIEAAMPGCWRSDGFICLCGPDGFCEKAESLVRSMPRFDAHIMTW